MWPKVSIFSKIEPKIFSFTSFCLVSTKASSGVMEKVSLVRCIKLFWKIFIFIICWIYKTKVLCWIIMLDALLLRLCSQDVKGWLLGSCYCLILLIHIKEGSGCYGTFLILWFLMLKNHICISFGSWCYWTFWLYYGSWCYGTKKFFRFRCYEPIIIVVGGLMVTTMPDVIGII